MLKLLVTTIKSDNMIRHDAVKLKICSTDVEISHEEVLVNIKNTFKLKVVKKLLWILPFPQ